MREIGVIRIIGVIIGIIICETINSQLPLSTLTLNYELSQKDGNRVSLTGTIAWTLRTVYLLMRSSLS